MEKQKYYFLLFLFRHHHHVLFPLREIGPCVLSHQASRSFTQSPVSVQSLNLSSPRSLSTVSVHGIKLLYLKQTVFN